MGLLDPIEADRITEGRDAVEVYESVAKQHVLFFEMKVEETKFLS